MQANEDRRRGGHPLYWWYCYEPVHFGVTSKHSPLLIRDYPPLAAKALLAVPLTTPFNINTMEPSLRPLRYALARQHTFISAHTHGQLIYLTCLQIKAVEWVVGVGYCHYVGVYVFGWGMVSTWFRLHPAGCAFRQGTSLWKHLQEAATCLTQTHRPNPALIWLSHGKWASLTAPPLHPANNSPSAEISWINLRINCTALFF